MEDLVGVRVGPEIVDEIEKNLIAAGERK